MKSHTNLFNRLIIWYNPFRVNAPLTEKPGCSFAQAETELPQGEILRKDVGPFLTFFFRCFSHIFAIKLFLFISNYGQALALEIAYIFKAFWAQSCLMVAVTYVCEEYSNLRIQNRHLQLIFSQKC